MKVMIDGVEYVPAMQVHPAMDDIAFALAGVFWGTGYARTLGLEKVLDGLCVDVNDNGDGTPITDVLADIARELK